MPREPKLPIMGSCIHCHKEQRILAYGPPEKRRISWCTCPGAVEEKHRVKVIQCRESRHRMEKIPEKRRHRKRWLEAYRKQYNEVIMPAKTRPCPRCGEETANYFLCHTCHTKNDFDYDFAIDTGESRRMGVGV